VYSTNGAPACGPTCDNSACTKCTTPRYRSKYDTGRQSSSPHRGRHTCAQPSLTLVGLHRWPGSDSVGGDQVLLLVFGLLGVGRFAALIHASLNSPAHPAIAVTSYNNAIDLYHPSNAQPHWRRLSTSRLSGSRLGRKNLSGPPLSVFNLQAAAR